MKGNHLIKIFTLALVSLMTAFMATTTLAASLAATQDGIQVYQKNLSDSPEHQQILQADIDRYHNANDLWSILRDNFQLEHYESNPQVKAQIQFLMNHQQFLLNSANRAAPYLYYILQQAKKRNLPPEVALLPIIESAFNPFAYSSAGAAGIWQMMPGTASGYGIKQNWWYDGRRDVIASTNAALNHLVYLRNFFNNNWLLAIAAYDAGEGNVLNAIKRNIREGYDTSFWSLPLSRETRDYVPRFLALATILAHPWRYPVYFPPVKNAPYLAQVDVGMQMDLKQAAALAGMSLASIMQFNPGYNRMITDPNGPYRITLPIENVSEFTDNLATLPLRKPDWKMYKVRHGDTLFALAKRYSSSMMALRTLNNLHTNHIKPGSKILIPHAEKNTMLASNTATPMPAPPSLIPEVKTPLQPTNDTPPVATIAATSMRENTDSQVETSAYYKLQPGDTIYMTRDGDTLLRIANHFKVPVLALASVNHVSNGNGTLQPGQRMIVPTHQEASQYAENNTQSGYQLAPGDTLYMVRPGDTMNTIAKRFHTIPSVIRIANLIADNDLHEGITIIIPSHDIARA